MNRNRTIMDWKHLDKYWLHFLNELKEINLTGNAVYISNYIYY